MRNHNSKFFLLLLILSLFALLVGCSREDKTVAEEEPTDPGPGNSKVLTGITITPVNNSIAIGTKMVFTAMASYAQAAPEDVTQQVVWSSTDVTGLDIATIATTGIAMATGVGTAEIVASIDTPAGKIMATRVLTVTDATLVSIVITPDPAQVNPLGSIQFSATGNFSDNTNQSLTTQVTWSVSPGTFVSIDSATGLATAGSIQTQTPETIMATFTYPSSTLVVGSVGLIGTGLSIADIAITPLIARIPSGMTRAFNAMATFDDGSQGLVTNEVSWTATNEVAADPTVATIAPGGLATSLNAGTASITVAHPAAGGLAIIPALLTVTPAEVVSIVVTPPGEKTIAIGGTQQFTATATLTDGSTLDITASPNVTWMSGDPLVASISNAPPKGLATGITSGSVSIWAEDVSTGTLVSSDFATLTVVQLYREDFELPSGGNGWTFEVKAVQDLWAVGSVNSPIGIVDYPTVCFGGTQCAGTVLDGPYPTGMGISGLLVSPLINVPAVSSSEHIHLQFQQWVSYLSGDSGVVRISVDGGPWIPLLTVAGSSPQWAMANLDLTVALDFAAGGVTQRNIFLSFLHVSTNNQGSAAGWYIDDVELVLVPDSVVP